MGNSESNPQDNGSREQTQANRRILNQLFASNQVDRLYFQNNQFTGFNVLPQRSTPTARITRTQTLQSNVNIDRNSFKLVDLDGKGRFGLTFKYTSKESCEIIAYFCALEVRSNINTTKYFYTNPNRLPQPITRQYSQAINEEVNPEDFAFSIEHFTEYELSCNDNQVYPIIVDIKPLISDMENLHFQASYLSIEQKNLTYQCKLISQKLTYQGKTYNLFEIYGGKSADQEQEECIVCMTNKKNTAVMPCKHLCLCGDCSDIMRQQSSSKCPICRTRNLYLAVESLLVIS